MVLVGQEDAADFDGPGENSRTGQKRHDNDHVRMEDILVGE